MTLSRELKKKTVRLNYKEFGKGEPLIILHGLFGSLDNWQRIAQALGEKMLVYIIDQRNHGKSPHTEELSYALMAADLYRFYEDHGIRTANVMGHSMGGKTAMHFALEYPDMVDKLLVVDMGIKAYPPGHESIFKALFSLDLDKIESREDAEKALSPEIDNAAVRQFLLKNLNRHKDHWSWKINLPVIWEHYREIIGKVNSDFDFEGETLFIRGSESPYIKEEDWPDILDLFPNAELKTIPKAGHWVHAEAPDAFVEMVEEFLGS